VNRLRELILTIRELNDVSVVPVNIQGSKGSARRRRREALNQVREHASKVLFEALGCNERAGINTNRFIDTVVCVWSVYKFESADLSSDERALLEIAKELAGPLTLTAVRFFIPSRWVERVSGPIQREVYLWKARRNVSCALASPVFCNAAIEYIRAQTQD
jgi:hypothetical protein